MMLHGAGEYNLNVVKEVTATKSYFTLDENVRQCQSRDPLEICRQRIFLETALTKCKCLPYKLMSIAKVDKEVR